VGAVILFSSVQSTADHALLKVNKLLRQHRWAWLSQIFLRCVGTDLDLIMNATIDRETDRQTDTEREREREREREELTDFSDVK